MNITAAADYERMNDLMIQRMSTAMERFSNHYQITLRESEILILIAAYGLSNREIAEQCVISEKTVKNHIANIMNKIGIQSMRKLLSLVFSYVLQAYENLSTCSMASAKDHDVNPFKERGLLKQSEWCSISLRT
jgi:DNA-binding NarL/FixJ family response regulator